MEKLDGKSFDVVGDNISKLKEIFPEVVNGDNQVDFENLRDILENDIEVVDDKEEHYKFTWWGKKESKRIALESTTKTLRPYKKDSKNWDTTENIYIEGDNLDALKILLGSYRNRIKVIYIDPPYNTGHDFVYKDNRTETKNEHLETTNQMSEEGYLFENPITDGKYHSNWLNMIYPRLYIARKLLTDDGVIFISIDDNEVANLKNICNEIFGESNFVGCVIRATGTTTGQDANKIGSSMDYLLVYRKSEQFILSGIPLTDDDLNRFKERDERGLYSTLQLRKTGNADRREDRPLMYYPVLDPQGNEVFPIGPGGYESRWRVSKETYNKLLEDDLIVWKNNLQGILTPYVKYYAEGRTKKVSNLWNDIDGNKKGSIELKELFNEKIFDNPKPTQLIELILTISNVDNNDIILDFFSGSATTADATFKYNLHNNKSINFIMIQIPEDTTIESNAYKKGFFNICEIGKERIRRAGDKIVKESGNEDLEIGFKVFKIDESNFIPWNPNIKTEKEVKQAIIETANNIVRGRSELDLIYELLLQLNLDLNAKIDEKEYNNHKFYVVNNGFMIICLETNIDESISKDVINLKEELMTEYCQVVLLDKALDSNSSINIFNDLSSENIELYTI